MTAITISPDDLRTLGAIIAEELDKRQQCRDTQRYLVLAKTPEERKILARELMKQEDRERKAAKGAKP